MYADWFDADYCRGHDRRFAASLEWLAPLLTSGGLVYDFGRNLESCPVDVAIREHFPVELRTTREADLRYPLSLPEAVADGVCLMEVIEHVGARDDDPIDEWTYAGIRNVLQEAHRLLKPGGWLFLTTPNLSRYTCAWNCIRGESPSWVRAHVRELGYCELRDFVTQAGFRIERMETLDVWQTLEYPEELARLMDRLCPDVPRGDCIFLLARRPEAKP